MNVKKEFQSNLIYIYEHRAVWTLPESHRQVIKPAPVPQGSSHIDKISYTRKTLSAAPAAEKMAWEIVASLCISGICLFDFYQLTGTHNPIN
jgi:hypothetical protein